MRFSSSILAALLFAASAYGQTPVSLVATPNAGRIVIDGRINEDAWGTSAVAGQFVQLNPRQGAPATERTEARVLYDDDAVYVAIRAHDQAPDSIVGQLARRDQQVFSDWVAVALDSYHDRRSAFLFAVNAAGVKVDTRITDDSREDVSWDAVWDAAVSRDAQGWSAELRIPFSQLRFNRLNDTWGINFRRTIARRDEVDYWAPIPANAQAFVSRFGELQGLAGLGSPERVEVVPYSVMRLTQAPGEAADPYYESHAFAGAMGGDLKVSLTPAVTLNATINPDFGQVEADPSVVNLSAFETFFPERRPFFIEGAELFRAPGPQVFYSRRIGRAPQGFVPAGAQYFDMPSNATILGAAKLSGRTAGGWSIGVLQAVTAAEEARYMSGVAESVQQVEPMTSYTVGRVARDFRRGQTAVGALVTAMHRDLDAQNLRFLRENAFTLTLDGRHRFGGGNYEVSAVVSNSLVTGDTTAIARTQRNAGHFFQRPDAGHLAYDPYAESLRGTYSQAAIAKVSGGNWRWNANVALTTPGYEINDVGFSGASDRITQSLNFGYYGTKPTKLFRRWSASSSNYGTWTSEPERIDYMFALNLDAEFHNYWGVSTSVMRHLGGQQPDMLRGGPAIVNPGSYMVHTNAYTDRRRTVSASLGWFVNYETGTDGYTHQVTPSVNVRPLTNVDLSIGPSYTYDLEQSQWVATRTLNGANHYVVGTVEQRSIALAARLNYTFAPTLSLQIYAQPFVAAGAYREFKEVRQPGAKFAEQFHVFDDDEIHSTTSASGALTHHVDLDRDGAADYSFGDPSFNVKQLRSTSVLRWEYRPGSALFLVWSHDRSSSHADGSFDLSRDFGRLMEGRGRNVVALKATYWLGF